jgi:hypothetical protein
LVCLASMVIVSGFPPHLRSTCHPPHKQLLARLKVGGVGAALYVVVGVSSDMAGYGGVGGAYLVGIPLQGSPGAPHWWRCRMHLLW